LQQTFSRARLCAPSIIFLDELDLLFQNRAGKGAKDSDSRLLSTLLTEMDGLQRVESASPIFHVHMRGLPHHHRL
jgi:SpoVK/Ycf46/Vps4 family AAA+-type ATPase